MRKYCCCFFLIYFFFSTTQMFTLTMVVLHNGCLSEFYHIQMFSHPGSFIVIQGIQVHVRINKSALATQREF